LDRRVGATGGQVCLAERQNWSPQVG
jgi:hypothetical protein